MELVSAWTPVCRRAVGSKAAISSVSESINSWRLGFFADLRFFLDSDFLLNFLLDFLRGLDLLAEAPSATSSKVVSDVMVVHEQLFVQHELS